MKKLTFVACVAVAASATISAFAGSAEPDGTDFVVTADAGESYTYSTAIGNYARLVKRGAGEVVLTAATTAFVSLSIHGNEVRVTAGDDGKGFAGSREGGNGLANMRERMADIGGTFAVGPREGGGCEVVLSFKLNGKP